MSVGDVSELSGRGVGCVLLSSSSLSVQSLKKKPPIKRKELNRLLHYTINRLKEKVKSSNTLTVIVVGFSKQPSAEL